MTLAAAVLSGDRVALSRLLTEVENNTPAGLAALDELFPHTGQAHLVGVTGAPGTGKSSLVNHLARHVRQPHNGAPAQRVAIVAVDPSSPFTGGAILGDRIRMRDLAGDPGVFIRSMATRGSLGGLAAATTAAVQVFDAAGYEMILIETVGAGQGEVDIARLAHTTLVVEAPGLGDEIQAIKAGILEIADILVVNKADRPGVENTERALRSMLDLAHPSPRTFSTHGKHGAQLSGHAAYRSDQPVDLHQTQGEGEGHSPATDSDTSPWIPPILRTVATEGAGISELALAIERHKEYLRLTHEWERREKARLRSELENLLRENLVSRWRDTVPAMEYQAVLTNLVERRLSPHQAVKALLNGVEK